MNLNNVREEKVNRYNEISNTLAQSEQKVSEIQEGMRQLSVELIRISGEVRVLDELIENEKTIAPSDIENEETKE